MDASARARPLSSLHVKAEAPVVHWAIHLLCFWWGETLPVSVPWLQVEAEDGAPKAVIAFLLFPSGCKASYKKIVLQSQSSCSLTMDKLRGHQSLSMCLGAPRTSKGRRQDHPPSSKATLQTAVERREAKSETLPALTICDLCAV